VPKGTVIEVEGYYDNSADNPKNPNSLPTELILAMLLPVGQHSAHWIVPGSTGNTFTTTNVTSSTDLTSP
jgi:hypothetical protein